MFEYNNIILIYFKLLDITVIFYFIILFIPHIILICLYNFSYLLEGSEGSSISLSAGNVKCCLDLVGDDSSLSQVGDPGTPVGDEGMGGDPLSA